ncbi:hypothetical protein J0S82_004102, partial [Galemys pyrenaicus]
RRPAGSSCGTQAEWHDPKTLFPQGLAVVQPVGMEGMQRQGPAPHVSWHLAGSPIPPDVMPSCMPAGPSLWKSYGAGMHKKVAQTVWILVDSRRWNLSPISVEAKVRSQRSTPPSSSSSPERLHPQKGRQHHIKCLQGVIQAHHGERKELQGQYCMVCTSLGHFSIWVKKAQGSCRVECQREKK